MKKLNAFLVAIFLSLLFIASCGKEEPVTKDDADLQADTITFENIVQLNEEGFYNGSDGTNGFSSKNAFFPTFFNTEWQSWSGFAVSNHTDTISPGFTNQFSSIAGSGAGNSEKYAILYSYSSDTIKLFKPGKVTNIGLSNSTYAYYSMKNGNDFSKKFGGATGNDPDFFDLHISAIDSSGQLLMFNPIPLADYTYTDNSQDYISKEWNYYDLSAAGYLKCLIFSFASSDTSEWGINTPTYVCIDNMLIEWEE